MQLQYDMLSVVIRAILHFKRTYGGFVTQTQRMPFWKDSYLTWNLSMSGSHSGEGEFQCWDGLLADGDMILKLMRGM